MHLTFTLHVFKLLIFLFRENLYETRSDDPSVTGNVFNAFFSYVTNKECTTQFLFVICSLLHILVQSDFKKEKRKLLCSFLKISPF